MFTKSKLMKMSKEQQNQTALYLFNSVNTKKYQKIGLAKLCKTCYNKV